MNLRDVLDIIQIVLMFTVSVLLFLQYKQGKDKED